MAKTEVKMIQTVDSVPGKDTTVYFTDGTHAVTKADETLAQMLTEPDIVAPNVVQVTYDRGKISRIEPVSV